jgi:hypothetical protein
MENEREKENNPQIHTEKALHKNVTISHIKPSVYMWRFVTEAFFFIKGRRE